MKRKLLRSRAIVPAVFWIVFLATAGSMYAFAQTPPGQPADAERTQWFRDAKFGLFIHWGVYSMIGREEWARQ
ncbi:MAG: alpha-L-fucosidase, partial [Candidatus Aminicenantes bacterium]|nr:alpha-L-fucosidase [Candidatus Aminicenantes bacterium]